MPPFSRDWALFLDVDGTLVELADRPENIQVDPGLSALLKALAAALDNAVALVSGRQLGVLDGLLDIGPLAAAGLHGVEWRMPGESDRPRVQTVDQTFLDRFRHKLQTLAEQHPELQIEDKRLSLAVHYRQAPHLQARVERLLQEAMAQIQADSDAARNDFHLMRGHMVVEIKSRRASKGHALREFMRRAPFNGRVPVFAGDDVTDEDGFAVVNEMGGLSVKIGNGDTRARYRLAAPADVRAWLGAYRDFLYA